MNPHLHELPEVIASAPVVIFSSSLTDTRAVRRALDLRGIEFREVRMGMGSAELRRRFDLLCRITGWRLLPQIFVDGRFVGGYDEFFSHPLIERGPHHARHG